MFHGNVHSPNRKRSWWWFCPTSCTPEVNYRHRKRIGPAAVSFPENEACDFILDEMDSILDDSNRCSYVAKQPISEFQKLDWFSNIYQLWHPSSTSKHRLSLLHRLIGCRNVNHLSGMLVFVKPFDISLIAFSNRPVFLTIHVAIFELLNFWCSRHHYTSHL